ncbi:hypothetical protein LCGC14_2354530 [marine sediment metagenome]|uniref:Uncharacterized protein n=1 Tax=marine sediment metagenome TaxID=412755 RepID=A0A0F9C843_9ZZZZ
MDEIKRADLNRFINEQFKILRGHCDRCMQRIANEMMKELYDEIQPKRAMADA